MFFTYQMATNGQQMTFAWIITLCFCKISWKCPKIYWLKIHFLYLYWSKDLFGWILSEVLFQKEFYARKPNIPQKQNTFCCIFFSPTRYSQNSEAEMHLLTRTSMI